MEQLTSWTLSTRLSPRTAFLLLLLFVGFYVLFFSPVLIEGRSLAPGDGIASYRPNYLPKTLWEPNLMTGFPVAADPQVMSWYPLAVLLSWLPAHSSLGPEIPENFSVGALPRPKIQGHKLPRDCEIRAKDILDGLHHEYWLEQGVA